MSTWLPSLITGFFLILVQILSAYWLSYVAEKNKRDINKELEDDRARLQAELQAKLHAFQTRYSLLHEKRALAIEELFSLLTRVQNDLQVWAAWDNLSRRETKAEFYFKTQDDFRKAVDFFDEKRIYFDEVVGVEVRRLVSVATMVFDSQESIESMNDRSPDFALQMKQTAKAIIDENIHPIMNRLEDRFKRLLDAEQPTE